MKIYDRTKTRIIENPDLELGYLVPDEIVLKHYPATPQIEEIGHYETIRTYPNGGKDLRWVVDVEGTPAREAYDATEPIQVYIPYTDYELAQKRVEQLKKNLLNTDYQAIKYAEGAMSESEYIPVRIQRQEWRDEINRLQAVYGVI